MNFAHVDWPIMASFTAHCFQSNEFTSAVKHFNHWPYYC